MANTFHRFTVGQLECIAVSDGSPPRPAAALDMVFSTAPKDELDAALAKHGVDKDNMTNEYTCLAVKIGDNTILVDTGIGAGGPPNTGRLLDNLRAAGVQPQDIDTLIISHAHGDHIGGITDDAGNMNFPNARFVIWKGEWEYWTDEGNLAEMPAARADFARKNLLPIADRVQTLDSDKTPVTFGVYAFPLPGHTPGHMAICFHSAGEQLIYSADAVLHPIHLENPTWSPSFDSIADLAIESRGVLGARARDEKPLILAYHFPFPGLGHIVPYGAAWTWRPLKD